MNERTAGQDVWSDLERRLRDRIEGAGSFIARLKELVKDRMPDKGDRLRYVDGKAYVLLLAGLETDVLYLMAKERRKDAARRFWACFGEMAGVPSEMELDLKDLSIRRPCCPACTMFWLGSSFETAEYEPEMENHTIPMS